MSKLYSSRSATKAQMKEVFEAVKSLTGHADTYIEEVLAILEDDRVYKMDEIGDIVFSIFNKGDQPQNFHDFDMRHENVRWIWANMDCLIFVYNKVEKYDHAPAIRKELMKMAWADLK